MVKINSFILFFILFLPITVKPEASKPSGEPVREIERLSAILDNDPVDLEAMKGLVRIHSHLHNDSSILELGRRIATVASAESNEKDYLYGLVSTGVAYYGLGQYDSMRYYFDKSLAINREAEDDWTMIMVYNCYGVYFVEQEMDYYKALSYFLEGVKYGDGFDDPRLYSLLSNIAATYYLRGDSAGLPYALDVYSLGHKHSNDYMIYIGSNICGGMYYILGDYAKALEYVKETVAYLDSYGEHTGVYNLYANILLAMGREDEAVKYYNRALEYASQGKPAFVIESYLNYGQYFMRKGRYNEAITYFEKGIYLSRETNNMVNRYLLYRNISESLEATGNVDGALQYYKMYHAEADSIFNFHKERTVDELRVKYETEKQEREIQAKEFALLREAKKNQLTLLMLAVILVAFGGTYILYRRRNRMYKQIVRQHHDFVTLGRVFGSEDKPVPNTDSSDKYSASSLSDEKGLQMFKQLEEAMRERKLYRDKDISIEKLAERLGTNRTYLSQIINEHTGASFNHYINSYRIDEAVRVLSDSTEDIQLKVLAYDLGFNYRETFYKSFQKAVGVSPSKYREEIRKMYPR